MDICFVQGGEVVIDQCYGWKLFFCVDIEGLVYFVEDMFFGVCIGDVEDDVYGLECYQGFIKFCFISLCIILWIGMIGFFLCKQ